MIHTVSRSSMDRRRAARRYVTALAATLALLAAGCAGDGEDPADPGQGVDAEPGQDEDASTDTDAETDGADGDGADGDDDADGADGDDADGDDEATDGSDDDLMLEGEPSTETVEEDAGPGRPLAVTDVRVGTHDGFDRVVFELEGDATAGWHIAYVEEPTAQGSGEPIEVEGAAALGVSIRSVTLPPELPDDIEAVEPGARVTGPEDGVIAEVVSDTIFEGNHTFVVGTSGELPFLVERLDDPQRLVIDIVHDG